jgi:hypothetical protein
LTSDGQVFLSKSQRLIVPKGGEQKTHGDSECEPSMVEPGKARNTGNVRGEMTVEDLEWIQTFRFRGSWMYQIKVKGELDKSWCEWLGSTEILVEDQVTTLTLRAADQSTLFGILDTIRDLNIPLISVTKDGQEI